MLHRELRDRNVDLTLERILRPFVEEDLKAEVLFNETTMIVAGRQNSMTRRRKIELADLIHEPWVFPAAGQRRRAHCGGDVPVERFGRCHAEAPSALPCQCPPPWSQTAPIWRTSPHLWCVSAAITSRSRFCLLRSLCRPSPVGIITLKRRTISPVVQLFIDHAREVAKTLAVSAKKFRAR